MFYLDSLEDLLQQLDKFVTKDLSVHIIADRYEMITMEDLDNQFNALKKENDHFIAP